MNRPLICQLCSFSPEVPGTFVDALLRLEAVAAERLQADTLFIFPAAAFERPWLSRFTRYAIAAPRDLGETLAPLIPERDAVILHSHFVAYDIAAARLALAYPKKVKTVTVVHLHSESPPSWRQTIKDIAKVRLLGRFAYDRWIAASDNVEANALARGVPRNRLVLIRNAIDVQRFAPNQERRSAMRAELGFKDDELVFLLVGWDPHRKGVDLFLEAASSVANRQRVVFCIVGQDATKRFVVNHPRGLGGTSYMPARLSIIEPVEDFPALLDGVDVLVSASRSEAGLPYAVLEAMAAEDLVIASEIAGVRQSGRLAPGVWLFQVGDARALAELLERAVDTSAEERHELGQANRAAVEAEAALQPWAERVVGIYEELLGVWT
jgi:glycosyltransferase involved in cell wall biosynthesis